MKDNKNDNKKYKRKLQLNDMPHTLGAAASATDMTGMIPFAAQDTKGEYMDMYNELMGVPVNLIDMPDEELSQAKMSQA